MSGLVHLYGVVEPQKFLIVDEHWPTDSFLSPSYVFQKWPMIWLCIWYDVMATSCGQNSLIKGVFSDSLFILEASRGVFEQRWGCVYF